MIFLICKDFSFKHITKLRLQNHVHASRAGEPRKTIIFRSRGMLKELHERRWRKWFHYVKQTYCMCMCVCVRAYWVDVYEEAVLILCWIEALHKVQQHRISIKEVRMRDEDWGVCKSKKRW